MLQKKIKELQASAFQWIKNNSNFIFIVFILFAVRWSVIDHYRVPSGSMLPTIQIGDHLLVNKMAYKFKFPYTEWMIFNTGTPKKGDIIVFKFPKNESINFVKRLVAVPGDEVEINDGFLKVNGKSTIIKPSTFEELHEKYINGSEMFSYKERLEDHEFTVQKTPGRMGPMEIKFIVPEDLFFFMGDNRENSEDSRFWGFVKRDQLKGRASRVLFNVYLDGWIPKSMIFRTAKALD